VNDLPTARTMLHQDAWLCLLVWCKACHHQAPANLRAIIAAGRGDRPLKDLRFGAASAAAGSPMPWSWRGMRCGCSRGEVTARQ